MLVVISKAKGSANGRSTDNKRRADGIGTAGEAYGERRPSSVWARDCWLETPVGIGCMVEWTGIVAKRGVGGV